MRNYLVGRKGTKGSGARNRRNLDSNLETILRRNTPEKVPLSQEPQLVDYYLAMEVTRFVDRLQRGMNIDPVG